MAPKTMRSNEIESYKKKLRLNKKQRSILVGMLLGDGHLGTQNQGKTYRLKVEHSIKQREYVDWLYEQFKDFVRGVPYTKLRRLAGKTFTSYGFTTYSLGLFRFYAQQFYEEQRKVMPKLIKKLLDPLALAIWFMDDGSFKSAHHKTYIIHALGYRKKDLELVKSGLQKNFGIDVRLHRQYDKWRLYITSSSARRFQELVNPYVIPILKYKLGNKMPKE